MNTTPGAAELTDIAERGEVTEVELWRVAMPLVTPHRAAHGVESVRSVVLVRVGLSDGSVGWGECPTLTHPTYSSEYTAAAYALMRDELVPWLLGGDGSAPVGHPMAVSALVGAHLDATLRRSGSTLADRLAASHGSPRGTVAVTAVIGRGGAESATVPAVDAVLAAVERRRDEGVAMVKLKVTPRPDDLALVEAVVSTWPDLAVAVDANGTLDARTAGILAGFNLAYVEQPAPADDLLGSAALARRLGCPVALDESVTSMAALEVALAVGAGSVVNVKPARLGGAVGAAAVARAARDHGCDVFVGGMLETAVGRATALAVAASPVCNRPTDLGPSEWYFDRDLADQPVTMSSGSVEVPAGVGIGLDPDPDRVAAVATEHGCWQR